MQQETLARFESNLDRSRNLATVYTQIAREGQGRQPVATVDILRAATVFLHASLEELIRNIARWKYPNAGEVVLNEIPIAGIRGRAERFYLGKLTTHRGKTIQTLTDESVDQYLRHFTVNNTTELNSFLTKIGIDPKGTNAEFPSLSELLERRHHIVHQADRNNEPGQGQHGARGLNHSTVMRWLNGRDLLTRVPD